MGKGTQFIVPNILSHPGSMVVTDPKAENYDITQRHRLRLGPVYRLDLIDLATSDQLNPLHMIRVGDTDEVDDASLIANLLITPDPRSSSHWDLKAREYLTAIILYLLHAKPPALHTLSELHQIVHQHEVHFDHMLETMQKMEFQLCRDVANDMETLARTDEGRSVFSNLRKAMTLWSPDRPAAQLVADSTFSLNTLKDRTSTLYLIIPPEKMALYAPFLRLFAGLALAALTRNPRKTAHPTILMLDEARLLGKLDLLPEFIALGAGYSTQIVTIWQDRQQIVELYGDDSILKMSGLQVYFGVNDPDEAKRLCNRIGQHTVRSRSEGATGQVEDILHSGHSVGASEAGRPVIYPSELMQSDDIFAFIPKFPAIRCTPAPYFQEKRFRGLYDTWRGRKPIKLHPDQDEPDLWAPTKKTGS